MFPVYGVEDTHPGARASRPHHVRHSLGPLRHSDCPETAPWVSFGLAVEVAAERLATFSIGRKFTVSLRLPPRPLPKVAPPFLRPR